MRINWITSIALLPIILSSCATFKGMPSLDMELPEQFTKQAIDEPIDQPTSKLQTDWWRHTDDNTLIATIRELEKLNLSLEQAQLRLNTARTAKGGYDYLPNLTSSSSGQFDKLIGGDVAVDDVDGASNSKKTTGYYSAELDASWEIPLYGQLDDTVDLSKANIAFAEADVEAVRASVISEAVRLYSEMRGKQQEVLKRESIVTAAKKIVYYQKIKHKAGLIADSELAINQQSLLAAQNELKHTENEKIARMQQLAKLLGTATPDDKWKSPASIPIFDVPAFDDTPLDVLRNRPDIRKAEALVLAAASELELSKSEMYPKLSLTGNLSQIGNITGNSLSGNIVQLTGIPSISLPLFDWSKRISAAKMKDMKLSEKASSYKETVIGAMNEVEECWSSYRTARSTEKSARKNAQIANKTSEHAALLFKQGINDGIEAKTATIEAANAAISALQANANTITQLTKLTKALGGISSSTTNEKKND